MNQKHWDRIDKIVRFMLHYSLYALVVYTAWVSAKSEWR